MRARSALSLFSASLMMASGLLMACGNGDDNSSGVPPVPDASMSGGDGGHGADAGDAGATTPADGGGADGAAATSLQHVYVIMMENHAYLQILGDGGAAVAPNLNLYAQNYSLATQYYGVTHPSLPNYLAAISGDFQGVWDDCNAGPTVTCQPEEFTSTSGDGTDTDLMSPAQFANASTIPHWFSGQTIVDQLEAKGLTWTAYMGAIPGEGDVSAANPPSILDFALGDDGGFVQQFAQVDTTDDAGNDAGFVNGAPLTTAGNLYAQKHNPFEYFSNIRGNTHRMQKIVPFSNFATDITGTTMPNYVWISPDQCQDIHSVNSSTGAWLDSGTVDAGPLGPICSSTAAGNDMSGELISYGDAFVGDTVNKIMSSPTWNDGSAIVIIFDEDDYKQTQGCCNSPTSDDGGVLGGAQVPAIVISSLLVNTPVTSNDPYNHYSMLATLQHIWGLGCLANTCGMSGDQLMTSLFLPSADAGSAPTDAGSPSDGATTGDN
jgi:hypothetical protein